MNSYDDLTVCWKNKMLVFLKNDCQIEPKNRFLIDSFHITGSLTEPYMKGLANYFYRSKSAVNSVYLGKQEFGDIENNLDIVCEVDTFKEMLKAAKALNLFIETSIPAKYLEDIQMKKIVAVSDDMDNLTLLSVNCPDLHIETCDATPHVINIFIKEWMKGRRTIENLSLIGGRTGRDKSDFNAMVQRLKNVEIAKGTYAISNGDKRIELFFPNYSGYCVLTGTGIPSSKQG